MSRGRTYEEEQEVVTAAVISIMHSLMEIANDKAVEAHLRVLAASEVLAYARDTSGPVQFEAEPSEEDGESEGEEAC